MLRGGKQEHRPWKRPAQSATSRETVALPKWSLAAAASSNVKLSEGVSGEKNVLVLFLRPPGHWLLKNFELSERKVGKGRRERPHLKLEGGFLGGACSKGPYLYASFTHSSGSFRSAWQLN